MSPVCLQSLNTRIHIEADFWRQSQSLNVATDDECRQIPRRLHAGWQEPVVPLVCTHTEISGNKEMGKLCLGSPKGVTFKGGVLCLLRQYNRHPQMSSVSLGCLRFKQTVQLLPHPPLTCKYKGTGPHTLQVNCSG